MKRIIATLLIFTLITGISQAQSAGKISGYMFADYFYNVARDTTSSVPNRILNGAPDYNAFQFRRIYFTYDNDISKTFTSRFRLEADQTENTSNGKIGVAVKDAYLAWKNVFHGSDLYFGIMPTPALDLPEAIYGFRSLEKTILDLRGIVSSRDMGIALKGKLEESGTYTYWLMIGDNSNNAPASSKFKRFYGQINANPITNLSIGVYADYSTRPEINDPTSTTTPARTLDNNIMVIQGVVGYSEKESYSVGVESFLQKEANSFYLDSHYSLHIQTRNAMGLSVYGMVNIQPDLILTARYDYFDPNTNSDVKFDSRNYYIFGLAFKPDPNISIIPNIQYETFEKGSPTGNLDPSYTVRVTFYWIFL